MIPAPDIAGFSHRRAVALVGALGVGQIIAYGSSFYLLGVLGDAIAADLHIASAPFFGSLSAAMLLAAALGPLVGRLVDHRGAKPVLLASNLLMAAPLVLLGLAPNGVIAWSAVALLGFGMASGLSGAPHALSVEIYGERARPAIVAVSLIGGFGSTLGWFLTAWAVQHFGWRSACFGWAAAHVLICMPAIWSLAPRRRVPHAAHTEKVRLPWDRGMVQLAVLFAGSWFVSTCMAAHLPRLLEVSGLTAVAAASTAGLLGFAAVSARLVELTLMQKVSPLVSVRVCTLLHPLGALALVLAGSSAAPVFVIAQGLANGVLAVASGALPLAIYGREHYGYRSALVSTPARIVQTAGPLVFGFALQGAGLGALGITGAICLVMFAMTFGLTKRA